PREGRVPGGWFVVSEPGEGSAFGKISRVKLDPDVTRDRHEDRVWAAPGEPGLRSQIAAANRTFHYSEGLEGVKGKIHSMLAADGKLFVVTEEGGLYCFGGKAAGEPTVLSSEPAPLQRPAEFVPEPDLRGTSLARGYGLVWGIGDGAAVESLLATELQIVAVDPDAEKVHALRRRLDRAGLYGPRAVAQTGDPADHGFPESFATVIVCPDPLAVGLDRRPDFAERLFLPLRPYGGAAAVALPPDRREAFEKRAAALPGARIRQEGRWTWLTREGALPGATNYTENWQTNRDEQVRAPLGVLWYDDTLGHFKRSPQPAFVDGIMVSRPKNWKTSARPYTLLPPVYSDVFTGRVLRDDDPWLKGKR